MTVDSNINRETTQEDTMPNTDRTHTRRLIAGLTLVIAGSFTLGVVATAGLAAHDAQVRDDFNTRVTLAFVSDLAGRDDKLTERIDALDERIANTEQAN